jgi:alanine racemase
VSSVPSPRPVSLSPCASLDAAVRPTHAQVDLGAIRHNVRVVREMVQTAVWGVVKADAYGHGAVAVARTMVQAGVAGLCVALVEEGLELRAAGITAPVLVMSGVYRDGLAEALAHGLTPVIYDPAQLEGVARLRDPARVHLKVDTGMARLGFTEAELARAAPRLAAMPHVTVEGLMTHLASADLDEPGFTLVQLERFARARALALEAGLRPQVLHAANSAGAFRFPEARFDLVRPGITLYGVAPFPHAGPALLPAFRLRTEILALREVSAGAPVGYAGAYVAGRPTVVATVPIGYADGFFRRLSSEAEVLIRGQRARVIGNVSMDMAMVDVSHLARGPVGVQVGDEVVLLGAQQGAGGADIIRAEEIAARVGTIPYEVLCAVSRRVPRGHLRESVESEP